MIARGAVCLDCSQTLVLCYGVATAAIPVAIRGVVCIIALRGARIWGGDRSLLKVLLFACTLMLPLVRARGGFFVGVWTFEGLVIRRCPQWMTSQPSVEWFGVLCALDVAPTSGQRHVDLVIDNVGAQMANLGSCDTQAALVCARLFLGTVARAARPRQKNHNQAPPRVWAGVSSLEVKLKAPGTHKQHIRPQIGKVRSAAVHGFGQFYKTVKRWRIGLMSQDTTPLSGAHDMC